MEIRRPAPCARRRHAADRHRGRHAIADLARRVRGEQNRRVWVEAMRRALIVLGGATVLGLALPPVNPPANFAAHEIATGLTGGYQVIAVDLNRDGRLDLVALASGLPELAWFENPSWKRHVIASGMTGLINVAAAELDGDGIPELAVASGFSTRPDQSSGEVALFTHGADPTQSWTTRVIDHVPSAHRMRWYVDHDGQRWLINSPLA